MAWIDLNASLARWAAPDSILRCESEDAHAHGVRAYPFVWLIWLVWLFGPPIFGISSDYPHWLWPTVASMPVFLALYTAAHFQTHRHIPWYAVAVAATALSVVPFNPYAGTYVIYACALAAEWGPPRRAMALMLALLIAFSIEWLALPIPWQYLANFWVLCLIVGGMGIYAALQRQRRAELRLTHDEIRRLAASAERERIGRDLHDLLGHTLSLVALKSELARRLVARDPRAASREIAEVEQIAREALAQVRSAVSGIRSAALASELASARLLLETAGVRMNYQSDVENLPADLENCLALVLREAATNIERHAHANIATVAVRQAAGRLHMQIHDDGRGGVAAHGNGLAGMRERVQALDGKLGIDSPRGGGTTIDVCLPLPLAARPSPRAASVPAPVAASVPRIGGAA